MDRARVVALTLALIAAIASPLCASSGWARGLGVLGLTGGGATVADPSAFYFDCESDTATAPNIGTATNFSIAPNATTATPAWKTGSYALDLTGSDAKMQIDASDFSLSSGSIEYDFSYDGTYVISFFESDGLNVPFLRYSFSAGEYYIQFGSVTDVVSGTLSINTKHHILIEWTATTISVTVDGTPIHTTTQGSSWSGATKLFIGGAPSWARAAIIVDEIYGY